MKGTRRLHVSTHRDIWTDRHRKLRVERRAAPKGGAHVTRKIYQYGIKVSSWESETFKIVIPVENHPQKPKNRLADYHPSVDGGVLICV